MYVLCLLLAFVVGGLVSTWAWSLMILGQLAAEAKGRR